jgi:hypothetical protein
MIDNNILAISNVMFRDKKDWSKVTDEQKEQFFFIFNRYFSKKYSMESQLLNDKDIDKIIGMDLWFEFMKTQPYPKWFWSKAKEEKTKGDISEKEFKRLLSHLQIKSEELDFLIKHHKDEIIEELEYLKKLDK